MKVTGSKKFGANFMMQSISCFGDVKLNGADINTVHSRLCI